MGGAIFPVYRVVYGGLLILGFTTWRILLVYDWQSRMPSDKRLVNIKIFQNSIRFADTIPNQSSVSLPLVTIVIGALRELLHSHSVTCLGDASASTDTQ